MKFWVFLVISFVLVAFGQESWIAWFSPLAASIGYALFWKAMLFFPKTQQRFWLSFFWFTAVQLLQLSWFTSIDYMGPWILAVYLFLSSGIGLQFAFLSLFFRREKLSFRLCLAMAGSWTLFEWVRIFFFSGFPWNPVGLSLASSSFAIQMAALVGIYGLSFWVIFVNASYIALQPEVSGRQRILWAGLALFPYLFGCVHQAVVERVTPVERFLSVVLVQTALLPEQKDLYPAQQEAFIPPLNQWERIWQHFAPLRGRPVDLIVLPEAAVPFGAFRALYPIEWVRKVWADHFGESALSALPDLQSPLAKSVPSSGKPPGETAWKVSNAYLAQAMANYFQSNLVVGFDDIEGEKRYNAAFAFSPGSGTVERYEKRVLVPIGEYLPFSQVGWLKSFFQEQFDVGGSFDVGTEPKLLGTAIPMGISICLEETYSHLIRDLRLRGARLLINLTNDAWFPRSRLPWHHFQHGRVRAAENGIYVLRSCNTGVTGVIDGFGHSLQTLPPSEQESGVLVSTLPLRCFSTLYTLWGDIPVLLMSGFLLLWGKRLPRNSALR